MNPHQVKGCKVILKKLSTEGLESLCDTVTKKQVKTNGREECIKAIVSFSESAEELLKRKKMSRDLLFKYLVEQDIVLSINAEKHEIISKILTYWNDPSKNMKISKKDKSDLQKKHVPPDVSGAAVGGSENVRIHVSVNSSQSNINVTFSEKKNNAETTVHVEAAATASSSEQTSSSSSSETDIMQTLGVSFTRWFFDSLNSHNPTATTTPQEFGPQHFWENSQLNVKARTPPEPMDESFSGAECVAQRLLAFVRDEQLLFCPNINKEGIIVKQGPHGQVVVLVCGTLHRGRTCLGMFEQVFGLVRDPRFENNWKVKLSKLKIQSSEATAMPKLTDKSESELKALMAVEH